MKNSDWLIFLCIMQESVLRSLLLKIQYLQFRIIRAALSLPLSVSFSASPANPPSDLTYLVIRSLRRLELDSKTASRSKRIYFIKNIPTFKSYILQKHILDSIHRSVSPSSFTYNYNAFIPIPDFHVFDLPKSIKKSSQ